MQLLTKSLKARLLRNNRPENRTIDHRPVVKFFGGPASTWLITEMDSADEDRMYGLCDLGLGIPELGYISLSILENLTFPPFGSPVERDRYFTPKMTLNDYYNEALRQRRIVA